MGAGFWVLIVCWDPAAWSDWCGDWELSGSHRQFKCWPWLEECPKESSPKMDVIQVSVSSIGIPLAHPRGFAPEICPHPGAFAS